MTKTGRPSTYSDKTAEAICERLSKGEPLARICEDDDMPAYSTARKWAKENEAFSAMSARAREDGTHYIADDCIKISDRTDLDPADKRVRIDTRIRLIGKWNAKAYGEKVTNENTGPGGGPQQHEVAIKFV